MNAQALVSSDAQSARFESSVITPIATLDAALAPAELLIVDDDEIALSRLRLIAESAGYDVRTARNGVEAIESLKRRFCGLMMTDVMMPEMDGLTLCRQVRDAILDGYVYCIILSVRDGSKDVVTGIAAGADDYISKRATKSEVLARLTTGRRVVGLERALRQALRENQQLTQFDPLTGCFNRGYLMQMLSRELERCKRYSHWVSVLVCDLDNFSVVNSRYGHAIGDSILQEVAVRCGVTLSESSGWTARCEGDRFVIVLPETALERACQVAESLRQAISQTPISTPAGDVSVAMTVGLTGAGPTELRQELTAMQLLDTAEQCLFEGKNTGRDKVLARAIHRSGPDVSRLAPKPRR